MVVGHRSGSVAGAAAAEIKLAAAKEAEKAAAARALSIGQQQRCGECLNCNQLRQV